MMMLEKNSADIAKYMGGWLGKTAKPAPGADVSKAMPPKSIPTFSTDDIARKGFFYAGGKYWGERRQGDHARRDVHRSAGCRSRSGSPIRS